jgi:hypothetical protein
MGPELLLKGEFRTIRLCFPGGKLLEISVIGSSEGGWPAKEIVLVYVVFPCPSKLFYILPTAFRKFAIILSFSTRCVSSSLRPVVNFLNSRQAVIASLKF